VNVILDVVERHPNVAVLAIRGLEYGYPQCCIAAFCEDVAAGRSPGRERIAAGWQNDGSGYVPCLSCMTHNVR
jgi:hypothetical protein